MTPPAARLRRGDLVEVRSPDEILQTLDADGALDRLPFMPEMVEFCGRRFRVSQRVTKTCYTGPNPYGEMRVFPDDDVVLLDGLRCAGVAHDGCQKACTIFWREAWLRRVDGGTAAPVGAAARQRLRARLKTTDGPTRYFCQSSELLTATRALSRREQFRKCLEEVRAGDCGAVRMMARLGIWVFWRIRRRLFGEFSSGPRTSTPVGALDLKPGEWVEVKSMDSIRDTLNASGQNRGLQFTPGMRRACGGRYQVVGRIERIIADGSGEMRQMHHTVQLEGSVCGCASLSVGGCARCEINYWREIWLERSTAPGTAGSR